MTGTYRRELRQVIVSLGQPRDIQEPGFRRKATTTAHRILTVSTRLALGCSESSHQQTLEGFVISLDIKVRFLVLYQR